MTHRRSRSACQTAERLSMISKKMPFLGKAVQKEKKVAETGNVLQNFHNDHEVSKNASEMRQRRFLIPE